MRELIEMGCVEPTVRFTGREGRVSKGDFALSWSLRAFLPARFPQRSRRWVLRVATEYEEPPFALLDHRTFPLQRNTPNNAKSGTWRFRRGSAFLRAQHRVVATLNNDGTNRKKDFIVEDPNIVKDGTPDQRAVLRAFSGG